MVLSSYCGFRGNLLCGSQNFLGEIVKNGLRLMTKFHAQEKAYRGDLLLENFGIGKTRS